MARKVSTLDIFQFEISLLNEDAREKAYSKFVTLDVSQFDTPSPMNEVAP
jgi:hypothetical protein